MHISIQTKFPNSNFEKLEFLSQILGLTALELGQTPQISKIQIFTLSIWGSHFEKLFHHTQLEENIGGVYNFWACKYITFVILKENDLH